MKKNLLYFFLLYSITMFCQKTERVIIQGNIQVPIGAEAGGITVYNLVSERGAVTNNEGSFQISVKLNDSLAISAVQYQKFIVIIDQGVLDTKTLSITVREAVNELEEVIVRPYDLSGNVRVDIQKVSLFENPLDKSSEEILAEPYNPPANQRQVENIAMNDPYMKNGLNFVNIFKAIFNSDDFKGTKISEASTEPKPDLAAKVRNLYEDNFFQEYINIEQEEISKFINFVQNNGLTTTMLQKGHELDLIEFLIEKGALFKKTERNN